MASLFRIPDVAIGLLLKFIKVLFSSLAECVSSQKLHEMLKAIPDTLTKVRTMLSINRDGFQRFIVCQRCDSTYDYNDCFPTRQIVNCTHVHFPRHPQVHMHTKCNEPLLKNVKTTTGKRLFAPLKVFLYKIKSLIDLIKGLIQQPGTLDLLTHWWEHTIVDGVMTDIYDGVVWQSFCRDGNKILASRYSIQLAINIDWFQPYTHVSYSVGVIYICVLNFPHRMRYLKGNIFVVGIIPGPRELKIHMNSYLKPLVRDLLKL